MGSARDSVNGPSHTPFLKIMQNFCAFPDGEAKFHTQFALRMPYADVGVKSSSGRFLQLKIRQ